MWHVRPKKFPFLFKIRGDEVGVVGLDKGDLGRGEGVGVGEGLVELDERGEPGLETQLSKQIRP